MLLKCGDRERYRDSGRKSPVTIWSHRIALDSRVCLTSTSISFKITSITVITDYSIIVVDSNIQHQHFDQVVSINASANQWDKDRHTFGKVLTSFITFIKTMRC